MLDAAGDLISKRCMFDHISARCVQDEVALGVERFARGAFERKLDCSGACARLDDEVVLELLLVPVVDDVHASVDVLISHSSKVGDVGVPFRGVFADDLVADGGLLFEPDCVGAAVGANETHGNDVAASAALLQLHHGASVGQERCIASALGEEVGTGVGLAFVDLEAQRKLAVGRGQLRLRRCVRRRGRQCRKAKAGFQRFEGW